MPYYYDYKNKCIYLGSNEKSLFKDLEMEKIKLELAIMQIENFYKQKEKVSVDKNISKSIVCDGAFLSCPLAETKTITPNGEVIRTFNLPKDFPAIRLNIPKEHHVFLMKKDPVATERDIENDNFEPLPGVYCSYDHEKCSIKSSKKYWSKLSKTEVNGYNLLLQQSELICQHGGEAKLKIVQNGQDIHISNAGIEKFFPPTVRKSIKIGSGALAIFVTIATPTPGDEAAAVGVTGEATIKFLKYKGWGVFSGTRTIINEVTGYDILQKPAQAAIGEEKGEILTVSIDFIDTMKGLSDLSNDISELTSNIGKKNEVLEEINENNERIHDIKKTSWINKKHRLKIKKTDKMKIPARFQLKNLEKTNRVLNENVKKITPYIHSGSLNVTNTVISVHNYTTDSLYLNSIEKVYYKDINEFSKKPYFSINQEYPEDE